MATNRTVHDRGGARVQRVSAEEARSGAIPVRYGFHPTPFGEALIGVTDRGICSLQFLSGETREIALARLALDWNAEHLQADQAGTAALMEGILAGPAPGRTRPTLCLCGTDFQLKVWEALLSIPPGESTTYQGLAQRIGSPSSLRPVGRALGRNPVAFLIPCHRVVRKNGDLGGYRWGTERKRAILAWEAQARPRLANRSRSQAA